MTKKVWLACLTILFATVALSVNAAEHVIRYRPTPFHGEDTWASAVAFPNSVDNTDLIVGGNGNDLYRWLLKFPRIEGLPEDTSEVALFLNSYDRGDSSTPSSMQIYALASSWSESSDYDHPLSGTFLGTLPAPSSTGLYGIKITNLYQFWQDGSFPNQGFGFLPTSSSNKFTNFRSSDYKTNRSRRPYLRIKANSPVDPPALKMPLPGGRSWILNTEVGAYDCASPSSLNASYDFPSHKGSNYFSIDLGRSALSNGQVTTYSTVPIYAAGSGKVVIASNNQFNGNHVVIDHDSDGNVNTGFQTRYLHFKSAPEVVVGQSVSTGELLGYMGTTGIATGIHLHFGVRYKNKGGSDVEELAFVSVDGIYLKTFMTECNSSGTRILYYRSTNPSTSLQ